MNAVTESLIKIFERDLQKLEQEIKLYPTEDALWQISKDVKNPGGNLCLHLCGNLQYYIGSVLGNTGYIRNRDNEFAARNVLREKLIAEIQATKKAVRSALERLDVGTLDRDYPEAVFNYSMTTGYFLIHLASHLSYHLGQINYLRRLL